MNILETMNRRSIFSLEVFPPRTAAGAEKLLSPGGTLEQLCSLRPDYISCTYGAGGTNVRQNLEVLDRIAADGRTTAVTHFTCIGNSRASVCSQLDAYLQHGICHLLALRGDLPEGWSGTGGDLNHATELVELIRREYGDRFTIAVAGSPEGHPESGRMEDDITWLKRKQDSGADYIMTQMCWDMDQFCRWMEAIRGAGITLPVDVGVMPVLDQAATIRMSLSRNGCALPGELCKLISRYWIFPDPFGKEQLDPEAPGKRSAFREAGIDYTLRQIAQYQTCGISGIHLYTLNHYEDTQRIAREAGLLQEQN